MERKGNGLITSNYLIVNFTLYLLDKFIARGEKLPINGHCEPYRATSRTFDTKYGSSEKIFKLIHDKEPPDDNLNKLVA